MSKEDSVRPDHPSKPHEAYMRRALRLAAKGEGFTSPNPVVGAVIVRNGVVVGEGYHRRAGEPHAEVEALRQAGEEARGATLYVTLEPCNHVGRTPPCTEAILRAGIAEVYYAVGDPNPRVAGSGHRRLAEAGIRVYIGPCTDKARQINRFFFHHIATNQPYIIAKFAASLDGKIATRSGESRWITGAAARRHGHHLRQICDAIVIGAGTALADNPSLTARLNGRTPPSHPLRILLDSRGRVPPDRLLFSPDLPGRTLVATTAAMPLAHRERLQQRGLEALTLPATCEGKVDLSALVCELGRRQLMSLLVEGGGEVLASFMSAGLVQEVWAFLAPIIIGGDGAPGAVRGLGPATLAGALRLSSARIERIGEDFLIRGQVQPGAPCPALPAETIKAIPSPGGV